MKNRVFILLGPPGSGKGTQAEFLKGKGFLHLSTGEILRKEIKMGTSLGQQARVFIDKGELVPDDIINRMVLELLEREERDVLLDGYPRSINQASALDGFFAKRERRIDGVLYLDLPIDVCRRRLAGRYFCPRCKKNYNLFFAPPAQDHLCDGCKISLEQRRDDREEVVAERVSVYFQTTMPLIEYYEKSGALSRINADASPGNISENIFRILNDGNLKTAQRD